MCMVHVVLSVDVVYFVDTLGYVRAIMVICVILNDQSQRNSSAHIIGMIIFCLYPCQAWLYEEKLLYYPYLLNPCR